MILASPGGNRLLTTNSHGLEDRMLSPLLQRLLNRVLNMCLGNRVCVVFSISLVYLCKCEGGKAVWLQIMVTNLTVSRGYNKSPGDVL